MYDNNNDSNKDFTKVESYEQLNTDKITRMYLDIKKKVIKNYVLLSVGCILMLGTVIPTFDIILRRNINIKTVTSAVLLMLIINFNANIITKLDEYSNELNELKAKKENKLTLTKDL